MIGVITILSALSVGILQPALGGASYKLSNAQLVDVDHATVEEFTFPKPYKVTVDHSMPYFEGTEWHYNITDPKTGKLDAFSIHIIDYEDTDAPPPSESDVILHPREVEDVDIPDWVCDYVYGCVNGVTYAAAVSLAQIQAAQQAVKTRLTANNNELAKRIIDNGVVSFSVGIISGVVSWFITNKIQIQGNQATDTCNTDRLEAMIAQLQADVADLGKKIQSGDSRPRTYDHYSENAKQQIEGEHLKHGCKPTKDSSDFQQLNC